MMTAQSYGYKKTNGSYVTTSQQQLSAALIHCKKHMHVLKMQNL